MVHMPTIHELSYKSTATHHFFVGDLATNRATRMRLALLAGVEEGGWITQGVLECRECLCVEATGLTTKLNER